MLAFNDIGDDEDLEEGLDDLFADGFTDDMSDEFQTLPDDDEDSAGPGIADTGASPNLTKPKPERSTMPTWLNMDYADTRERISAEMKKNSSKQPTCYDKGTFWDGSPLPYFVAKRKYQILPEHFYKPKYFVWIPHALAGRIPCPNCLFHSQKSSNGNPNYLSPNSFPKAPRRVVGLDENIYIIGHRYCCKSCGKAYQSWSPALLSALPRTVAAQFTHHLTYRSGLTDEVISFLRACFLQGIGPTPFAKMIRMNHIRRYEKLHLEYLVTLYSRAALPLSFTGRCQSFGAFDDSNGFAGFTPSGRYFRDFYVTYIRTHAAEMDQYTGMLPARVIQIDHSFKVLHFLRRQENYL